MEHIICIATGTKILCVRYFNEQWIPVQNRRTEFLQNGGRDTALRLTHLKMVIMLERELVWTYIQEKEFFLTNREYCIGLQMLI